MKQALVALLGSRKFLVVSLATLVVGTLVALGKIPVRDMATSITALSGVLVAAIAYEDGKGGSSPIVSSRDRPTDPEGVGR